MAEYVAFDPDVEVSGASIMSLVAALGDEAIPVLKEFGLYPLQPDKWYKQVDQLAAYKKLREIDMFNEVAIGMHVPNEAPWPPHIQDVHSALSSINEAYKMNHRGGEFGGYYYTPEGERSGTMVCRNPYPSDLDYGIIYRVVQKFRDKDSKQLLVIRDENEPSRKNGDDSCTYRIKW